MKEPSSSPTSGYANQQEFSISNAFSNHLELGSNGYCRLFKAARYGKWYVLKGLQPQHASDPLYMAMLEKEFEMAVKMEHPNIVHVYSHETDAVVGPCIVMEYIDGRTLAEFLKENPPMALRRKVVHQLLDAMSYYHALQIVHRDLKPSNILVTRNGDNVKLIDFGLADADDYAMLKEPAYTKGYAAPEQVTEGACVDCRTDLFAFGVLLSKIFPHRYRYIVHRCTRPDPNRRFRDARTTLLAIKKRDFLRFVIPVALIAMAMLIVLFPHETPSSHDVDLFEQTTDSADDSLAMVSEDSYQGLRQVVRTDNPPSDFFQDSLALQKSLDRMHYYSDSLSNLFKKDIVLGEIQSQEAAGQRQVINLLLMHLYMMQLIDRLPASYRANWHGIWYDYNDIVLHNDSVNGALIDQTPLPKIKDKNLLYPTFKATCDSLNREINAIRRKMETGK